MALEKIVGTLFIVYSLECVIICYHNVYPFVYSVSKWM